MAKDEIFIEGIENEETEALQYVVESLEDGDIAEVEYIEGFFSSAWKAVKKVAKKVVKPYVKSIAPAIKLVKSVVKSAPDVAGLLTSVNPAMGSFKLGAGLFKDLLKVEKKTGKSIKYGTKFVGQTWNNAYAKGFQDALAQIRSGKIQVTIPSKMIKKTFDKLPEVKKEEVRKRRGGSSRRRGGRRRG